MKILLTGAHFTPALAVISELKKIPNITLMYIGRFHTMEGDKAYSAESKIIPTHGVKFYSIDAGRVQKHFSVAAILSILKLPVGFLQSFVILLKENPDMIVSFGGYVSVPVVVCAWLLSIPIIIHEQTLVAGLANKLGALFADRICLGFGDNMHKSSKMVFTGNPIREEIFDSNKPLSQDLEDIFQESKRHDLPVILVTGGNQGSHVINIQIESIISELSHLACVIHQTGQSEFEDYERLAQYRSSRYMPVKWVGEEIGSVLSKTDLIIGRAGVNTLLEAAYWGIPSLVIPIPYLYQDEQQKNAEFFQELGLCKILKQDDLEDRLLDEVKNMLNNLKFLTSKAGEVKKIVVKDAAARITAEILSV